MTELDRPRYGLAALRPEQREIAERFLGEGARHALLVGPTGIGKGRTAGEIATATARQGGRVLIVASVAVGRAISASARHAGFPVVEVTKALLRARRLDQNVAPLPMTAVAFASPQLIHDPWAVDSLSGLSWDLIIADELSAAETGPLDLLVRRTAARLLEISRGVSGAAGASVASGVEVYRIGSQLLAGDNDPGPELAARFHAVEWDRDPDEVEIGRLVDDLVDLEQHLGRDLGLRRLPAAYASSNYALQAMSFRLLDRIVEERNALVHLGPVSKQELPPDRGEGQQAALRQVFEGLERLTAKIDLLETDSRQNAFVSLVLEPSQLRVDRGLVIFCALAATADYVANGLQLARRMVVRPSSSRPDQDYIEFALRQPRHVVVVHDAGLKGLDLRSAHQAINYDVDPSRRRMYVRWSRLDWTEPSRVRIWTLLPRDTATSFERKAMGRMPYLAGMSAQL
jgi:AAA domain